jgi:hypothetical protein
MTIEQRPCPSCGIPNTAHMSDGVAVCFNCRATWDPRDPEGTVKPVRTAPPAAAAPAQPPEAPQPFPFTPLELKRLLIYRAAVRAGFFNDGPAAAQRAA